MCTYVSRICARWIGTFPSGQLPSGSAQQQILANTEDQTHHPLLAILASQSTSFCTYSLGSHDTLRHCQRARACRCGGEKSRALRQGRVFQLFVQMALWDTLGSGMDQHFAPELFDGTSKTTTFYKGVTMAKEPW